MTGSKSTNRKISFFIPNFKIGGIEVSYKNLCNILISEMQDIELVYCENIGPLKKDFHKDVHFVKLNSVRIIPIIWDLKKYFEKNQPAVFITPMYMLGNAAIIARMISKSKPKLMIGARSTFSEVIKSLPKRFDSFLLHYLSKYLFRYADRIISVSKGVENDLIESLNLDSKKIKTIYNPVIDERHIKNDLMPPNHEWFLEKNPSHKILISIGRLAPEKGFEEIIDAFAEIEYKLSLKLLIIGEGDLKNNLNSLINKRGLNGKIQIIGFRKNYLSYLAHSHTYILNSFFEGLPATLIEALAMGCNVISSDCNHGPREILENGKYGILFPVGDKNSLKRSIIASLSKKKSNFFNPKENNFTAKVSRSEYLKEINNLLN